MPTQNYAVAAGADDWQITYDPPNPPLVGDSSTTINASYNDSLDVSTVGIFKIDTTDFEDLGTITGMTIYFQEAQYTKTKQATIQKAIEIDNPYDTVWYRFSDTSSFTFGLNGYALDSTAEGAVNNSGYTYFRAIVDNPGLSRFRSWVILAYEYSTGGFEAYLAIDYEDAGGQHQRAYFF